jgi:putative flippase GtrA
MNPVRRWLKFNVVGVAGMLVQLVTLAGLNHIVPRHYLVNALIAVETAILHNFIAHVHYTWRDRILRSAWRDRIGTPSAWRDRVLHHAWRDRRKSVVLLRPLWRFQVSNGAVSLAGNAALMKLLVGRGHLPVLVASCVAIFVCGLVNFWLGDNWAFAAIDCHGNVKCYRSGAVPTTTGCGGV